ncbi:MAG: MFS transporter [Rhodospirillaceae bacterium]
MNQTAPARGTIGTLLLIVFIDMLAFGIIIPFMPFWAQRFGASPALVAILFATYSLFAFLSSVVWGTLSDRWGRKPVICLSMLGSAVSFAWISQADALWMLFAARALSGLMGGTISVAQAYVADITPRKDRAARMGLVGAAIGAGFVVGPGIGWPLSQLGTDELDFRTVFLVAAAVSLAGFVASVIVLREPPRRVETDVPRSLAGRFRTFVVCANLPVLFLPLIVLTLIAFCMGGLESTFALWSERQLYWGVRENAIFFFFVGLVMVVVQGGVVRPLVKRVGEGPVVAAGALMMAAGFATVLIVHAAPMAFVGGALIAIGFGLANPALHATISLNAPEEHQGAALGASQSAQSLCRILGPTAAGLAFGAFGRDAPYLGGAVLLLIAFLVALRMLRHSRAAAVGAD